MENFSSVHVMCVIARQGCVYPPITHYSKQTPAGKKIRKGKKPAYPWLVT